MPETFRAAVANRSVPSTSVIPVLIYDDVSAAIGWLCATFGFSERLRIGDGHAQIDVGDGAIFLSASRVGQGFESPDSAEFRPPLRNIVSQTVLVRVEDVEKHYERVKRRGAKILQPPATYPFGERQYTVEDLGGHRWTFSQSVADVAPQEWGATVASVLKHRTTATPYLCVRNANEAIEFYKRAFGALETQRMLDDDGKVAHAEIEIAEARLLLSDEYPEIDVLAPKSIGGSPVMIVLDVADVDALFEQATAAGATVVRPLQDGFDGTLRTAKLVDPEGHRWMIVTHKST